MTGEKGRERHASDPVTWQSNSPYLAAIIFAIGLYILAHFLKSKSENVERDTLVRVAMFASLYGDYNITKVAVKIGGQLRRIPAASLVAIIFCGLLDPAIAGLVLAGATLWQVLN